MFCAWAETKWNGTGDMTVHEDMSLDWPHGCQDGVTLGIYTTSAENFDRES